MKSKNFYTLKTELYRKKAPLKYIAHKKVNIAICKGILVKPPCCSLCNKRKPLDSHHHNYHKPLEVTWLCRKCHMFIHKKVLH